MQNNTLRSREVDKIEAAQSFVGVIIISLLVATLFTHEVDAALQKEWRLLYVLRDMPEHLAASWFVAIHIPLFAFLIAFVYHPKRKTQTVARIAVSTFAIVHAGLHFRLRNDPLNLFVSPLSIGLIYGAASLGVCYLCMWRLIRRA
ncbi:MAG: DUF6713 family protein [Casimicrobium sp.]